jgi:hypothetical protein
MGHSGKPTIVAYMETKLQTNGNEENAYFSMAYKRRV